MTDLVAQRGGEDRLVDRLVEAHAQHDRQRPALLDRRDPLAAGLEPRVLDLARHLIAVAAGLDVGVHQPPEVQLVVRARDLVRLAERVNRSALHQHRAVAEPLDRAHVVRDEDDRLAGGLQPVELIEALLLERGVADGEHLVDQQHVGVDLHGDGERQPDAHARRVVLELEVEELLQLGERDDLVESPPRLAARQAEHHRVDHHVVARGQVRVEADAELDEGREPPSIAISPLSGW